MARVKRIFNEISGLSIFKLPWADALEPLDFISDEKRKQPVDFWRVYRYDTEKEKLVIDIPEGKKLAEMHESIEYSCDVADFEMVFKHEGRKLIVTREMKIKGDFVPIDKFNEFRKFFENVITADNKLIAFK